MDSKHKKQGKVLLIPKFYRYCVALVCLELFVLVLIYFQLRKSHQEKSLQVKVQKKKVCII
jgi:hypothetical protein